MKVIDLICAQERELICEQRVMFMVVKRLLRWPGFVCSKAQDPLFASSSNKGVSFHVASVCHFTVGWKTTTHALIYNTYFSLIKKKMSWHFFLFLPFSLKYVQLFCQKYNIDRENMTTYTTCGYKTKWREAWNGPVIVFFFSFFPILFFFFCECAISYQQPQAEFTAWSSRPCTRDVLAPSSGKALCCPV